MAFNEEKLNSLFKRALNTKQELNMEDETKIQAYLKEVFGEGVPSQHELHQFNKLVVKQADEIARQKASDILSLLADYVKRPSVEVYQYTIPREFKAKVVWSAHGTSVEHTRVEGSESRTATPTKLSTGLYYETLSLQQGDVQAFRNLVNQVADAKVSLYFQTISKLMEQAIANGDIPAANVVTGSNLSLTQFNTLITKLARYGGRPVFVADTALIDHFAFQQATDTTFKEFMYDDLRKELAHDLSLAKIGRATAVSLVNPFISGSGNTVTELPVDEGYVFAGGAKMKPFKIIEFGGMTQYTTFDTNLEQVQLKLYQECAFEFIQGELVGYIQDDSIEA